MTTGESKLKLETRTETGSKSSKRLRREGKIPAIIYGHQKAPKQCVMEVADWQAFLKQDSQLAKLMIDSKKTPLNALIKDIQHDYLSGKTLHVDFQEINMNEEITTNVAVEGKGTPAGVSEGGVLNQALHELEVTCLPNDLPDNIEVDVSEIELGGSILVKDIEFPEKVICTVDPESTVFYVSLPKVKEEVETPEGEEGEEGEAAEGATEEKTEAKEE